LEVSVTTETKEAMQQRHVDELYDEAHVWHVNTGDETIHAKRMPGRFRTLKWLAAATWLSFFFGPYLRWGDRQAVLFDIGGRKFHIFGLTILPQDIWMLSLTLLFLAILLAVVTSIAGRVYCGYFCFQTIWTDVFTWIEDKLEGNPGQRRKLEKEPVSLRKLAIKAPKHLAWIVIGALTGLSFIAWFTDVFGLWHDYLTLQASFLEWAVLALFTVGTYGLAGFMREQACFWLCPYARIQGVMIDRETILPAYDFKRGEPRGKLRKDGSTAGQGDCIDCGQCLHVCPTGVDIRNGQQEGCITCGLCIDACDAVMEKISKPKGLVRYASLDELEGKGTIPLYKRPRVLVYFSIMTIALVGILFGLSNIAGIELKVLHERQPLYVQQSDGTIQNKYYLKVLNKTDRAVHMKVSVESGPEGLILIGADAPLEARPGDITRYTVYARVPRQLLKSDESTVEFRITAEEDPTLTSIRDTQFFGPR
jgi:cytochrome c oxidase accessory protein FixG